MRCLPNDGLGKFPAPPKRADSIAYQPELGGKPLRSSQRGDQPSFRVGGKRLHMHEVNRFRVAGKFVSNFHHAIWANRLAAY